MIRAGADDRCHTHMCACLPSCLCDSAWLCCVVHVIIEKCILYVHLDTSELPFLAFPNKTRTSQRYFSNDMRKNNSKSGPSNVKVGVSLIEPTIYRMWHFHAPLCALKRELFELCQCQCLSMFASAWDGRLGIKHEQHDQIYSRWSLIKQPQKMTEDFCGCLIIYCTGSLWSYCSSSLSAAHD